MICTNRRFSIGSVITSLLALVLLGGVVEAKEWRGIKPLHTTRQEVEAILGVKSEGRVLEWYSLPGVTVMISYSMAPCEVVAGENWNVPPHTVTSVGVTERNSVDVSSLQLNLGDFEIRNTDVNTIQEYVSEKLGWTIVVVNGKCRDYDYYGTKEEKEKYACHNK